MPDAMPRLKRTGVMGRGAMALGLLWTGAILRAQLPQPVLNHVFPAGVVPGRTNELTVSGGDLDGMSGLVFTDPRVKSEAKPGASGVFLVAVPAEVPPGPLDARVTGRFGVSNPRVVMVEPGPARLQAPTNTASGSAARLASGEAAWGRLAPASSSWFSMELRKGERALVRVLAPEVDSRLVPDLAAFDASGAEVARTRRLGWIDFEARSDGEHRVQLTESLYRGGDDHFYRIERVTGPHVDFALPAAVRAGVMNRVALFGRRLPGGKRTGLTGADGVALETVDVDVAVPAEASVQPWPVDRVRRPSSGGGDVWAWRWSTTNGVSNPVAFALTALPVASAGVDLATGRPMVASVAVPVEFGGVFPRAGELSGVSFPAKKGEVWWVEVTGDRLGQGVDPAILIQRERGTKDANGRMQYADVSELPELDANPGGAEFPLGSRDSLGKFEVPEDGTYRVLVRDLFNTGSRAMRRPYRLSVRRAEPGFRLVAWAQPPPKANGEDRRVHVVTPELRRGGTLPLRMAVWRRDGFDGPIELGAEGLPPGVACLPTLVPAGAASGTLLLTASDTAAPGAFAVRVRGRAVVGTNAIVQEARAGGAVWVVGDHSQEAVAVRMAQVTQVGVVPEDEPVVVRAREERVYEVKAGGKLEVPLVVLRRFEFPAAFNLKPAGHGALDKAKELNVPEKATNAVLALNLAETALPEGEHTLWLQGQVSGKYRNQPEALASAEAALKAADEALKSASAEQKGALEQRRKDAEAARKAAEERAKPRDVTLGLWSAPIRVRVTK